MGGNLDPAVARARLLVRRGWADLPRGTEVVVALSGGADSTALVAAAAFEAGPAGLSCRAVVVDHGLQDGSAEAARAAAERARTVGVGAEVVQVSVGSAGGPEAAARDARYAALREAAERHGADAVLLGHTRDDQAETVLLGLARGSGPRSLAAMAPVDGLWRRPLLPMTREETRAMCAASGLSWWDDPHNADRRYARVRVRTDVLPALEDALGPGESAALARTADLLREDADLLDALADEARGRVTHPAGGLDVAGLAALPAALRGRVLLAEARAAGCPAADLSYRHVQEVDRLVTDWRGQVRVELPGSVHAVRVDGVLLLRRP